MQWNNFNAPIENIQHPILKEKKISLALLREDLNHPEISGNKYRKLKYNLIEANKLGYQNVLTFGGAFSNHIAATAAVAKIYNFKAIGIIRGEEIKDLIDLNPTLKFAQSKGMTFDFVTREEYRNKNTAEFIANLKAKYPYHYIIPEGGTNPLAIKGCEEILYPACNEYNIVTTAIGTGGTITGLINSAQRQQIIGFPALKGDFILKEIRKLCFKNNYSIINDYHFGGYGKVNDELIQFINQFKIETNIQLDPLYTGKLMFGIFDLIKKDYFAANTKILAVHTGGLQGIEGINNKRLKQNKTIIQ